MSHQTLICSRRDVPSPDLRPVENPSLRGGSSTARASRWPSWLIAAVPGKGKKDSRSIDFGESDNVSDRAAARPSAFSPKRLALTLIAAFALFIFTCFVCDCLVGDYDRASTSGFIFVLLALLVALSVPSDKTACGREQCDLCELEEARRGC